MRNAYLDWLDNLYNLTLANLGNIEADRLNEPGMVAHLVATLRKAGVSVPPAPMVTATPYGESA